MNKRILKLVKQIDTETYDRTGHMDGRTTKFFNFFEGEKIEKYNKNGELIEVEIRREDGYITSYKTVVNIQFSGFEHLLTVYRDYSQDSYQFDFFLENEIVIGNSGLGIKLYNHNGTHACIINVRYESDSIHVTVMNYSLSGYISSILSLNFTKAYKLSGEDFKNYEDDFIRPVVLAFDDRLLRVSFNDKKGNSKILEIDFVNADLANIKS